MSCSLASAFAVLALSSLAIGAGAQQEGGVITYPVPDPVKVCPYAVTVNGIAVPIEQAGAYQGAYYARFEFAGSVRVQVKVKATAATMITLKPERFRTNLAGGSSNVAFDVDSPGPRVITVVCGSRELWPLVIFAEKPRDSARIPAGARVFRVSDYVNPEGVQTANIQRALDDCAAQGGGYVEFGPGTYLTGPLFIKDNTTVVLSPGTLIQGSADPQHYRTGPALNHLDSRCPGAATDGLINFNRSANSRLTGPGVIDGAGHILREHGLHVRTLQLTQSESILIEDVVLRNAATWTMHLLGCSNVTVDSLKILADWAVGNTDGINPDCSRNISITNYFGFCGDDALAVKTTSRSPEVPAASNITVRDSIVMTRKTAFKIGTETHKDVSGVLIERCEAINSSRGIGLYMRDGATIFNATYRDIRLDLMEYPGEGSSGAACTGVIENRSGIGKIDGITFERVSASVPFGSEFSGKPESMVRNVVFRDCTFEIRNRGIKMNRLPLFSLANCSGFEFTGCRVHWNAAVEGLWDGFLRREDCEEIAVDGLEETRQPRS